MQQITLQDIITKKLNMLSDEPDSLICDAYYQAQEADNREARVRAYIATEVAIRASKAIGTQVPNLEEEAIRIKRELSMTEQEMADYYLEHLDN